jgi:hypothetical protein
MALHRTVASSRRVLLHGLLPPLRSARRHLGFANVVASLALVVSLGGTAVASVLITSNSQVAAHTIAGANAPTGKNKNLIGGSVGTIDLHNGAVSPAKLAAGSRAHKIDFVATGTGETNSTLLQLDELTFAAGCHTNPPSTTLSLTIASSVAGDVNYGYINEVDGGSTSPVAGGAALGSGSQVTLPNMYSYYGDGAHRHEGQFVYRNSSRVITVTFHAIAWYDANHYCQVTGTALPASAN